jgi:hypothetical protein
MICIFADFQNASQSGNVRLNTVGTLADIEKFGIVFHEGMRVLIDDRDTLSAEGTIRWEPGEGWVAQIDWDRIESRD